MTPEERWYHQEVERIAQRSRYTVARLARAIAERCGECQATLHHTGYIAPGGRVVTLTTCPHCDRKDDDA